MRPAALLPREPGLVTMPSPADNRRAPSPKSQTFISEDLP
jgi:hypothetical protein